MQEIPETLKDLKKNILMCSELLCATIFSFNYVEFHSFCSAKDSFHKLCIWSYEIITMYYITYDKR